MEHGTRGGSGVALRAPVLLTDATWYGTLAAARDLGAHGVPVVLAIDGGFPPAKWSAFVSRTVRAPNPRDPERFLAWMLEFGARHPGHVYYPTSDNAAWLVSVHREALSRHFHLYSPLPEALACLLDKARMTSQAKSVGLDVPQTWAPEDEAEVERIAAGLPYPVLIKPRSQVFNAGSHKGLRIFRRDDLVRGFREVCRPKPAVGSSSAFPGANLPVLQECVPKSERIYTVDGFIDRSGEIFVTLGCTKLLQSPRGSGAGVIFEETPVHAGAAEGLRRLFRSVGFHGIFDAEFLEDGDRMLLIDVNPRIYNHMDFEVKRGLPLAWLAYLGAIGDLDGLAAAAGAERKRLGSGRAYVHGLPTRLLLLTQRLYGNMSAGEIRSWKQWIAANADATSNPLVWPGDRGPVYGDILHHLQKFLEHPRAFLRALGETVPPS